MSTEIITTEAAEYTHNVGDYNPSNNNKWYYKLKTTVTGSGENITQKTEILRSYTVDGDYTAIGTLNNNQIVS